MKKIDKPVQLILIRHAESARNKAKKGETFFADEEARKTVKGIPDHEIPLTDHGLDQARQTGVYLRDRFGPPDYVYHSGYRRTIETAENVLNAFTQLEQDKIHVRMNPFIRERDPGYTYDMTAAEAKKHFPWLEDYWKTFGGFMARPPGGESLCDVAQRVRMFYDSLKIHRPGQKVWVFSHGGTIRSLRFVLERWHYRHALKWAPGQSPKNCGITLYEHDASIGRLVMREYNTVAWT